MDDDTASRLDPSNKALPHAGRLAACFSLVLAACGAEHASGPAQPVEESAAAEPEVAVEGTPPPMDSLHGHLAYAETDAPLGDAGRYRDTGRVVQLRAEAAASFRAMQQAAREAGVNITPISGFRTKHYQDGLFSRAIGKYGSTKSAARWVAPPGYSEHHSGLAVDIGDTDRPETDVETTFEDTPRLSMARGECAPFRVRTVLPQGKCPGRVVRTLALAIYGPPPTPRGRPRRGRVCPVPSRKRRPMRLPGDRKGRPDVFQ